MSNEYMLDALNQTATYLGAQLETHVLAVEAARTVIVPRWKSITTSLNLDEQVPFIEILPDSTEPEYGEEESPYSEEHWNYNQISILVTHAGYVQGDVQDVLMYYAEAIERVVKADFTFGDVFNRVRLGRANYALLIDAQEDGLIRQTLEQFVEIRTFSS